MGLDRNTLASLRFYGTADCIVGPAAAAHHRDSAIEEVAKGLIRAGDVIGMVEAIVNAKDAFAYMTDRVDLPREHSSAIRELAELFRNVDTLLQEKICELAGDARAMEGVEVHA